MTSKKVQRQTARLSHLKSIDYRANSFFPFDPETDLCCRGCKWALSRAYQATIAREEARHAEISNLEKKLKRAG